MNEESWSLVTHLGMTRLPVEGTYFVSTYRSAAQNAEGEPVGTAMLGLYCADPPSRSMFHRLTFDEVWHFYRGDAIRLVLLHADSSTEVVILGPDVLAGQRVQVVVPAGTWQAGELVAGGAWALFGCTVAPGFIGTCFEGGHVEDLLPLYPEHADDIMRLGISAGHETRMPRGFAT